MEFTLKKMANLKKNSYPLVNQSPPLNLVTDKI